MALGRAHFPLAWLTIVFLTFTNAVVHVLVLGGTGNLAGKYIWPALDQLAQHHELDLWAATQQVPTTALPELHRILPKTLLDRVQYDSIIIVLNVFFDLHYFLVGMFN